MSSDNGQHRQGGGGASGDASGQRTVPREYGVGQERGGDIAPDVRPPAKDADISTGR